MATPKKPKEYAAWKGRVLMSLGSVGLFVASVSAATIDLNATVGPILESVTALIPSILGLIVGIVPAIIVLSVVGFIVAFFDKILGMMKV